VTRSIRFWRVVIFGTLGAIVAAIALVYLADAAAARWREEALDQVTVYVATKLKNGQLEIYYHQPETEVCVRSMFPHLGHRPCWYVRRHPVRVVG